MSARKAAVLVMAKMALADGSVAAEEREMLEPLLGEGDTLDSVLEAAGAKKLDELVAPVDAYADRFFIALRARSMAAVDEDFDASEEALYERLIGKLEISAADREVIERHVAQMDSLDPTPPDARLEELYKQSSFS